MDIGVMDLVVSPVVFLPIHIVLVIPRFGLTSDAENGSATVRSHGWSQPFCFEYVSHSSTFGKQTTEITLLKLKMSLVNRPLLLIFQYLSVCPFSHRS